MAHCNTVLNQVVGFFKRHEFESFARKHHVGQKFRSFNRWSQFMAMLVCQLSDRKSLRDVVENLKAQGHKLYHLGIKKVSGTTVARVNDEQPAELYKALFYKMLQRCRSMAPKNRFKIDEKVYLLDATIINLCLAAFPWATYRQKKGAIKLHIGLDADGYLPEFIDVTDGRSEASGGGGGVTCTSTKCSGYIGTGKSNPCRAQTSAGESGRHHDRTHNPNDETRWVSCLRENLTSSS